MPATITPVRPLPDTAAALLAVIGEDFDVQEVGGAPLAQAVAATRASLETHDTEQANAAFEAGRRVEAVTTGPLGPCEECGEAHAIGVCPTFAAPAMCWEQQVQERLHELRGRIQGEGCDDECIPWQDEYDALRALYPEVTL